MARKNAIRIQSQTGRFRPGGGPRSDIFHSSSTGSLFRSHGLPCCAKLGVTGGGIEDAGFDGAGSSGAGAGLSGSTGAADSVVVPGFGDVGVRRLPQLAQNRSSALFSCPQLGQVFKVTRSHVSRMGPEDHCPGEEILDSSRIICQVAFDFRGEPARSPLCIIRITRSGVDRGHP